MADAGKHSVTIRLRGGNGKEALADLQDNLASQDALIQTQREQIAALQADSRKQQAQLNRLSEQVANNQAQLLSFIEQAFTILSQSHTDMIAQLWESLRDLPEQHADTEPIIAVEHEPFAPPRAEEPAPAPEPITETGQAPPPEAFADLYAPLELAPDDSDEPQAKPAPIPPRPQADEQLKVMRRFIDAGIRFVDYIGEDLPKSHVNRLEEQGKLERHKFHPYKLRPTTTGRKWFEQATEPPPVADDGEDEDTQPMAAIADSGELEDVDTVSAIADSAPAPPASDTALDDELEIAGIVPSADELADDIPALDTIVGEPGSDSARLMTLLRDLGGATQDALQACFPPHSFVSVIVDEINESALDLLDDNLILEEDGKLVIDEAYSAEVKRCLDNLPGIDRESDSGGA